MKRLLFLLLLISSMSAYSQSINGTPLADVDVEFVQIVGTSKFLSNKVTIEIDFGQNDKFLSAKDRQLMDESGKKIVFNSMIDALNFMSQNGYNFVTAYAVSHGNQNVYHYLLRKTEKE